MVHKDKNGTKLYPTCGWEKNQHKLYNAYDRACNLLYDIEDGVVDADWDKAYNRREEISHLLEVFNSHVISGTVYAPYEDSVKIKEYVAAYDFRGDVLGFERS